jgi:hypothetical protein
MLLDKYITLKRFIFKTQHMIETPPSEIVDRYTIVKLKVKNLGDAFLKEYNVLSDEVERLQKSGMVKKEWVDGLYRINSRIWDYEVKIRAYSDNKKDLAKIGELALLINHWNVKRTVEKSKIVKAIKIGFVDQKRMYSR